MFFELNLTLKSFLMRLFWTFNLSFAILATVLATIPNIGQIIFNLLVTLQQH